MPAPQTHSQRSFAVHIFPYTAQDAQDKLKKDWQEKSYNLAAGKNAEQPATSKLLPTTSYCLFFYWEPQLLCGATAIVPWKWPSALKPDSTQSG